MQNAEQTPVAASEVAAEVTNKEVAAGKKSKAPKKKKQTVLVLSVADRNEARREMEKYFRENQTTVSERNQIRRKLEADFREAQKK